MKASGANRRHAASAFGAVAALLLSGCGADATPDGTPGDPTTQLERIARHLDDPVYWLGPSFDGLPLTHAEGPLPPEPPPTVTRNEGPPRPPAPARGPFLVYGECKGEGSGDSYTCTGPQLQIQHWPLASPSRYPRGHHCTRTTIRGVPAAQFDHLEVYVGSALVTISAPSNQARRAAAALRRVDGTLSPPAPLPPPAFDLGTALRRCALDSLDAKLEELRAYARIPILWAGREVHGRPLFRAEGDGRWARFRYGGCDTPEVMGSCWPPVTIEVTPNDESRPARWHASTRCSRRFVRGAPAAAMPSAHGLFVFTGAVTVHLHGPDATVVRTAAEALRPLDAAAAGDDLPPPPDDLLAELAARCSPG